jgi:hypothetical protein
MRNGTKNAEKNCQGTLVSRTNMILYSYLLLLANSLGLEIEPSQIRLKTEETDDPYVWDRLEEKDYLFSKNLSDHSLLALRELFDGVEVFFRAVPKAQVLKLNNGLGSGIISSAPIPGVDDKTQSEVSFRSRITELKEVHERLVVDYQKLENKLCQEAERRRHAEDSVVKLEDAALKYTKQEEKLLREVEQCHKVADCLRSVIIEYDQGLTKVLPLLNMMLEVQPEPKVDKDRTTVQTYQNTK